FFSTIIVGPIIDSFGNKTVLTTSAALVVAGLLCFMVAGSFVSALSSAFLLGFGGGGLNTAANALVADLYPQHRGAMLNVLDVFLRRLEFDSGCVLCWLDGRPGDRCQAPDVRPKRAPHLREWGRIGDRHSDARGVEVLVRCSDRRVVIRGDLSDDAGHRSRS